jgi:nucleotide-binding universal stress UspA family protein
MKRSRPVKKILLPLDGSAFGERALLYATRLARSTSARLLLVRATHARTLLEVNEADAQIGVINQAEHELAATATRLRNMGLQAEVHVYYDEPVSAILNAARHHQVDLIVMSTHGRSGAGRMLYGSVADDVLRHAEAPVLLVPSSVDHEWPTDEPLTALVPLDGSDLAEAALSSAALLATQVGAKLHLLRVVEPPSYPLYGDGYVYVPIDEEAERADAELYLQEQVKRLAGQGVTAEAEVAYGQPDVAIAKVATEHRADLVVMATHGRGGLARLVLGSVAMGTLRRAHIPLLLTRPLALERPAPQPQPEAATPSAPPAVTLTLTPNEMAIVRHALSASLADHDDEGQRGDTLRGILGRLQDAEATAAGASSPDLVETR